MSGKELTRKELLERGLIDENGYPAGELKEAIQSHPLIVEYKKQLERERKEHEEKARRIEENKTVVSMFQLSISTYRQLIEDYEAAYYELTDEGREPEKGKHLLPGIFHLRIKVEELEKEMEKLGLA